MKSYLENLVITSFLTVALLGLWSEKSTATIVTVDNNITAGFMQVFALDAFDGPDYGALQFSSNWLLPDVKSTVSSSSITLEANYNTYQNNPGDAFWRENGGVGPGGNKWMVASTFAAGLASSFPDGVCNFKAEVSNYNFIVGYEVKAFVKGFDANYNASEIVFSDLLDAGSVIDLTLDVSTWVNVQYGFEVQGINANPAFPPGSATIIPNVVLPVIPGIPNAGFEIPDGASWAFDQENDYFVLYPTTGGNPGGYAEIDALLPSQPFFGVLVSNGGFALPLAALSLTPGETYIFAVDIKLIEGSNIGGFKVDFVPNGTTGDMYPGLTGDGSEWATYSFPVTVPLDATGLKIVGLWGPDSLVGYDNFRVAGPFAATIAKIGSDVKVRWPTVVGKNYQVRKCDDLVNWAPFGAPVIGNGATFSVTDPIVVPGKTFFQVSETTP